MTRPSPTKTEVNLWSAFILEGKAQQTYVAFAMRAMEEGHPEVAQVFMEVSGAEIIHGISHLRLTGAIRDTLANLRQVAEEEAAEMETTFPRMIREAEADGRMDAMGSFRMAMERGGHHERMFREALELLERKLAGRGDSAGPGSGAEEARARSEAESASRAATGVADLVAMPSPDNGREMVQERGRIADLNRLREVMFGMQDGLVSTVALVNSVALATKNTDYVIVAGLTGALAGVFSMAAGSYLGSRAEQDVQRSEMEKEAREIAQNPAEEMAELVEVYRIEGYSADEAYRMAERVAADSDLWLKTMAEKELGLTPNSEADPIKDSAVMGASFFIGGLIPVAPFFFLSVDKAPIVATVLTLAALFLLGVGKGRLLQRPMMRSGFEVVAVGTLSALFGFLLGDVLPRLMGITVTG